MSANHLSAIIAQIAAAKQLRGTPPKRSEVAKLRREALDLQKRGDHVGAFRLEVQLMQLLSRPAHIGGVYTDAELTEG